MVYAHVLNCVSIGLFCRSLETKTPKLPFGILWSPVGSNVKKLKMGAQLQTIPYPTISKSFLYSNAFMAKSCAQTLTFTSVTDKQTIKKLNVFGCPDTNKLGMVIEDLKHVLLASLTLFGVRLIVLLLGGAENLGET